MAAPLWQPLYGSSSTAAPLPQLLYRSPSMAAPLRQTLFSSSSMAAPQRQPAGFRPLTPSHSFCNLRPLQPLQLAVLQVGCSYLFPAVPTAIIRPLPPSSSPCRHHAVPAAVKQSFCDVKLLQPLQLVFFQMGCSYLFPVAPFAIMRPLPPSNGLAHPW
jgi:hypothetical protein